MEMSVQLLEKHPSRTHIWIFTLIAVILGAVIGVVVGKVVNGYLLLAVAVSIVVGLLTIANLEFGLNVFILLTYLRLSDILVHNYNAPSIARAMIVLLLVTIGLRWAISGHLPKGWIKPTILVAIYAIVIFGSILYAANFVSAQEAAADYWKDGLITILVVALLQNKKIFRQVVWTLIIAGIFMSVISVYQYNTGTFSNNYFGFAESAVQNIVGETEGNRVAGPIGDPNFYAQILVVLVPLALDRFLNEKSTMLKILAAVGAIVITLTVFYTFSRGGFLALLVALAAFAVYKKIKLYQILILVIIVSLLLVMMPNTFLSRMGTIPDVLTGQMDTRSEVSFRGRASEMLSALYMFMDHPVLGVGVNNYPEYYQYYARQFGLDTRAEAREPHNLFLQVAAETGLLGSMIFGAILVFCFLAIQQARKGFRNLQDKNTYDLIGAFSSGLIGYLAASMFIHGAYPRYLWLLVGIALALPQILKTEKQTRENIARKD